jgi:preprotein translocase subunit SecG
MITNVETGAGWWTVWLVSVILEILVAILMLIFVKMPKVPENTIIAGDVSKKKIFKHTWMSSAMVIAIVFFIHVFIYLSFINQFYPTYIQGNDANMAPIVANLPTNLVAIVTIPVGIIAGLIADKFSCRKILLCIGYLCLGPIMIIAAISPTGPTPYIFAILMGIYCAIVPTMTRASIPILAQDPAKTDYSLASMAFFTATAQIMAVASGAMLQDFGGATGPGWMPSMLIICLPMAIIAFLMILVFTRSDKSALKIMGEEEAEELREMAEENAGADPAKA